MDRPVHAVCYVEDADQIDRIAGKHTIIGHGKAFVFDDEIFRSCNLGAFPFQAVDKAIKAGCGFGLARFKGGTDNGGKIANVFGHQKIAFHETLDARHAAMGGIAQALGNRPLHIKGKPFLGAPRNKMQLAPDAP